MLPFSHSQYIIIYIYIYTTYIFRLIPLEESYIDVEGNQVEPHFLVDLLSIFYSFVLLENIILRSNYCQLECGCPGIAWLLAFAEFGLNRKALEAVKSSSVLTIITNITILVSIAIIFHQHHIFISGIVHLM